jgi:hypothetical protein
MRKIIVVLCVWAVFSIGISVIQSCVGCGDGPYNYRLVSIAGEAKKVNGMKSNNSPIDYYTVEPYVLDTKGVRYDSIGIEITNSIEPVAFNKRFDVFNTAFACDPAQNFEALENVTITSSEDYANLYPAGTDLGEIISVRAGYQVAGSSISTHLASNPELDYQILFFTFNIPPSSNKVHNLTIKYKIVNGKEYEVLIQGLRIHG